MRVALYNQMFGMNGNSVFSNVLSHWAVHFQKNVGKIHKKAKLMPTIKIIKKSKADIIGICEVLEGQEEKLEKELEKIGYSCCFFGEGHKTKHTKLSVKVAVASKVKCKPIEKDGFPVKNEFLGGGGYIRCNFPELKTDVWCVHLASPRKKRLYKKQMVFLQERIKKSKNKVILMGDFNLPFKRIKNVLGGLELASDEIKTCSVTPLFKFFKFDDIDHIFVEGYKSVGSRAIKGLSDHKLIMSELVQKNGVKLRN